MPKIHSIPPVNTANTNNHIIYPKTLHQPKKIKPEIITTHRTADIAAQQAIKPRIALLPNIEERQKTIGKYTDAKQTHQGLMWPRQEALKHPAAKSLHEYSINGCPVDCGVDWDTNRIMSAIKYGAHPSAKAPDALKCLITEAKEKATNGFAKIITWGQIKNNIPKKFKLSPIAMIPHKSRAFRGILDLSFQLRSGNAEHKSVNETTNKMADEQSMKQLGSALKRIVAALADGQPKNKKFMYSKLDIKDGFWRMVVNEEDAWNFCYIIPSNDKNASLDDTKIVVPNSLQMGWCESPAFFCAASETARDVIQQLLKTTLPPHNFELLMTPKSLKTTTNMAIQDLHNTITLLEVFVDDFIGCTDDLSRKHLLNLSRAMLHGIHTVFPPPDITQHAGGDPISEKKLNNEEGLWSHTKEILGWIIDGANYTINLPPNKVEKITKTLKKINKRKVISLNEFQKIAGSLHHASTGIPGGRGLFTAIWRAMVTTNKGWIKLTPPLKAILRDFTWLFKDIANNPINVAQIVPTLPNLPGYTDACKYAAGGVWILPETTGLNRHVLWTVPFPPQIIALFINGTLSINDLEMAAVLLGWLVLEHLTPSLQHIQAGIQCDNSSTVGWTRKFTARSLVAGHLLRALALRQQICKAAPLLVIPIAGALNDMADVASRHATTIQMQKVSPSLLSYFNLKFPQQNSWEEFHLPQKLTSRVMSSLQGTQLTLEWWRRLPGLEKNTGDTGVVTQQKSSVTRYSKTQTLSFETSSSPLSLLGSGAGTTVEEIQSKFKASLTPFRPSARPSSWQDTKAPSTELQTNTTSSSNDALKGFAEATPHPSPN